MTGNDLTAYINAYNLQNEDIVGLSTEPAAIYFTAKRSSYNLVNMLYIDDNNHERIVAYDEQRIRSILSWGGILDQRTIENAINNYKKYKKGAQND